MLQELCFNKTTSFSCDSFLRYLKSLSGKLFCYSRETQHNKTCKLTFAFSFLIKDMDYFLVFPSKRKTKVNIVTAVHYKKLNVSLDVTPGMAYGNAKTVYLHIF